MARLAQVEDTAATSVDDGGHERPAEAPAEAAGSHPDVRLTGLRKTYGEVVAVVFPLVGKVTAITSLGDHWPADDWVGETRRSNRHWADTLIECLPGCCGPGRPAQYAPVTSGEHRLHKFLKTVRPAS